MGNETDLGDNKKKKGKNAVNKGKPKDDVVASSASNATSATAADVPSTTNTTGDGANNPRPEKKTGKKEKKPKPAKEAKNTTESDQSGRVVEVSIADENEVSTATKDDDRQQKKRKNLRKKLKKAVITKVRMRKQGTMMTERKEVIIPNLLRRLLQLLMSLVVPCPIRKLSV